MLSCVSVCWCLVVTCWGGGADLLALVCGVWLWRCPFLIGILGQVWCLIVSILIFALFLNLRQILSLKDLGHLITSVTQIIPECFVFKIKKNNPLPTGNPIVGTFANSKDPDKMQYNAAFHLGLHCLLKLKQTFRDRNAT